jgi:hypothetical protein
MCHVLMASNCLYLTVAALQHVHLRIALCEFGQVVSSVKAFHFTLGVVTLPFHFSDTHI